MGLVLGLLVGNLDMKWVCGWGDVKVAMFAAAADGG